MNIAYISPLRPIKSGISDFAEELLPYLAKHTDIDVFSESNESRKKILNNYNIYHINKFKNLNKRYDNIIYQIGNQYKYHHKIVDMYYKFGGIIELHDISLQNYLLEETKNNLNGYISIMEYCHGKIGREYAEAYIKGEVEAPCVNHTLDFPVNKHIIENAKTIIVHSLFAKNFLKDININNKIIMIPLHISNILNDPLKYYYKCRKKMGISKHEFVIGSFGYITESKRINKVLNALAYCKKNQDLKFRYYLVGALEANNIFDQITKLQLEKEVYVTGYVSKEEYEQYLASCDLCINLRYPTQGESSAALGQMIGFGKNILVSDNGSYREYPDDIVKKIPTDGREIDNLINAILNKSKETLENNRMQNIVNYARLNFSIEENVKKYMKVLEDG